MESSATLHLFDDKNYHATLKKNVLKKFQENSKKKLSRSVSDIIWAKKNNSMLYGTLYGKRL